MGSPRKEWPEFDIPFEVPYKNATRDLVGIKSTTTFPKFLMALAQRMDTRVSLLSNIAYVLSYKPKSPKPTPKLLEDEDVWYRLIEDVASYIESCKAAKKNKGVVKPFHVKIFDTSVSDGETAKVHLI